MKQLLTWNNIKDVKKMYTGMRLVVKKTRPFEEKAIRDKKKKENEEKSIARRHKYEGNGDGDGDIAQQARERVARGGKEKAVEENREADAKFADRLDELAKLADKPGQESGVGKSLKAMGKVARRSGQGAAAE